jgi:hypothetical protein
MMTEISYSGYRFPPEIIQQAIWLYVRFTLSFRDVEDLLAVLGIMVSYETVRRWMNHFGPKIAADLRKRRPKPHTSWHQPRLLSPLDRQHSASPARGLCRHRDKHAGRGLLRPCFTSSPISRARRRAAIANSVSASATTLTQWKSLSRSLAQPSFAPTSASRVSRAPITQYLDHGLGVMKADKKAIFTAASKASEAAAFLTALQGA